MKISYTIQKSEIDRTVYDILKKKLKISRRHIITLKKDNGIALNGFPVFTNHTVNEADVVSVDLSEKERSESITPENIPIDIVYEDEHLLVINKPRSMAVHPTLNYESGTLANAVMYYYKDVSFVFRPVNRLDKDTSGLVLIAKNKLAAERLSEQLRKKEMEKEYLAVTCGVPAPPFGTINASVARAEGSIIKRQVCEDGSFAETDYAVLEQKNGKALVKVHPKTGRTHQIRVHLAHIGCPLYADFLYGTEIEGETFYLHCSKLAFRHPVTSESIALSCNTPEYFKEALKN